MHQKLLHNGTQKKFMTESGAYIKSLIHFFFTFFFSTYKQTVNFQQNIFTANKVKMIQFLVFDRFNADIRSTYRHESRSRPTKTKFPKTFIDI